MGSKVKAQGALMNLDEKNWFGNRRPLAGILSFVAIVLLVVSAPILVFGIGLFVLFMPDNPWPDLIVLPAIGMGVGLILIAISNYLLKPIMPPQGLCRHCGYDLRGNPAAQRCPECGEGI